MKSENEPMDLPAGQESPPWHISREHSLLLLIVLFGFLLFAALSAGGQPPAQNPTRDAMRFKLYFTQGVLEGITTENFALIATNAQKLKGLSQSADWKVRSTREYQRLTSDFERANESLERAANNRNVDAATVAYFQLTTSCVTCHKYLRGAAVGWHRNEIPVCSINERKNPFGTVNCVLVVK